MGSLIIITWFVMAVALMLIFSWAFAREARLRTESLGNVAAELGLEFSATQDEVLLKKLQDLPFFNLGHNRRPRCRAGRCASRESPARSARLARPVRQCT